MENLKVKRCSLESTDVYLCEKYPTSGVYVINEDDVVFVIQSTNVVIYICKYSDIKDLLQKESVEPKELKEESGKVTEDFVLKFAALMNKQKVNI